MFPLVSVNDDFVTVVAFKPRAVMNAIRKVSKSFFISFFLCVVIGLVAICCGVGALPFYGCALLSIAFG